MKFLCLHGYTQNGELFALKASGLRKALTKAGHELLFVSGPLRLQPESIPFEVDPSVDMRGWWEINEKNPDFYDLNPAFLELREIIAQKGPFDGLIGFSQGAALAAALCQNITELVSDHPKFKACVIFSGFKLAAPQYQRFYDSKITTPTLHIMGTMDTILSEERCMELYDCCDEARRCLYKHPGGHFVPSQKPVLDAVKAFIQRQVYGSPVASSEKNDDSSWGAFDVIGKN